VLDLVSLLPSQVIGWEVCLQNDFFWYQVGQKILTHSLTQHHIQPSNESNLEQFHYWWANTTIIFNAGF